MFEDISPDNKPLPGDYIRYQDEWGQYKGSGVLVKHVVDKRCPLTESYYLLKNCNTQTIWRVRCHRYTFTFMRHKTRNHEMADYIRNLLVVQEGKEKIDEE